MVDTSYKYFENRIGSNFKIFTARYKSEDEIKPTHMRQEMGVIEKIKKKKWIQKQICLLHWKLSVSFLKMNNNYDDFSSRQRLAEYQFLISNSLLGNN